MTYTELLKDPRWQQMRLEILQRDEWTCQFCFDSENTLHVHHLVYHKNHKPWDYDPLDLLTLCESCHENEKARYFTEKSTNESIRQGKVDRNTLMDFGLAIYDSSAHAYQLTILMDMFTAILKNPELQKKVYKLAFPRKTKPKKLTTKEEMEFNTEISKIFK